MIRSSERLVTTHTGSLPRPPDLETLHGRRWMTGTVDHAELDVTAEESVRTVVQMQATVGIDVANDGEQRRDSFSLYLRHRLEGLEGSWKRRPRADVERYPQFKAMRARALAQTLGAEQEAVLPVAAHELRYLKSDRTRLECAALIETAEELVPHAFAELFCSAPSPGVLATTIRNDHYGTEDAYLAALGSIMQLEYEAISGTGLLLQVDCPDLALERHIQFADQPLSVFLEYAEKAVDVLNTALENIPRDRVRLHVCWGNSESPHDLDVPLEEIIPILLRADVGALVLPFSGPRHGHEYRVFDKHPLADDQLLVAGSIDTLTNVVEHPQVVADRLVRAARVLGDPSRLVAGTDCGFESAAGSVRVSPDVAWAKLGALVTGARLASDELF